MQPLAGATKEVARCLLERRRHSSKIVALICTTICTTLLYNCVVNGKVDEIGVTASIVNCWVA